MLLSLSKFDMCPANQAVLDGPRVLARSNVILACCAARQTQTFYSMKMKMPMHITLSTSAIVYEEAGKLRFRVQSCASSHRPAMIKSRFRRGGSSKHVSRLISNTVAC
jgi:hypothetical protein